jgi:hypothetical protein
MTRKYQNQPQLKEYFVHHHLNQVHHHHQQVLLFLYHYSNFERKMQRISPNTQSIGIKKYLQSFFELKMIYFYWLSEENGGEESNDK